MRLLLVRFDIAYLLARLKTFTLTRDEEPQSTSRPSASDALMDEADKRSTMTPWMIRAEGDGAESPTGWSRRLVETGRPMTSTKPSWRSGRPIPRVRG